MSDVLDKVEQRPMGNKRKSSADVWVVDPYYTTSRVSQPLTVVVGDDPKRTRTPDDEAELLPIWRAHQSGVPIAENRIPRVFRGDFPHTRFSKGFPDFFSADGFFLVSERCAAVFRQFDLGSGGLVPVEIYEGDCATRVPGQFFLLNFGCQKSVLMPDLMDRSYIEQFGPTLWFPRAAGKTDDAHVVNSAACEGPDLWHDPQILKMFFMSGRLADGLRAAKVARTIGMYTCRIADTTVAGGRT